MNKILEVKNLVKRFDRKEVIKGIDFSLESGKVLGILGPNGQGKTTLLNLISGLLKPNFGSVKIDGVQVGSETKRKVSYLQEKNNIYRWMNIREIIEFYNDFYDDFNKEEMKRLLKFMNLDEAMKVNNLSKGMCEKLALSLTLSRDSKLYILDEPISGVDPVTREKIMNSIIEKLDGKISIIITTHYVDELEKILDEVMFLGDGAIVEYGNADDIKMKYNDSLDSIYRKIFAE